MAIIDHNQGSTHEAPVNPDQGSIDVTPNDSGLPVVAAETGSSPVTSEFTQTVDESPETPFLKRISTKIAAVFGAVALVAAFAASRGGSESEDQTPDIPAVATDVELGTMNAGGTEIDENGIIHFNAYDYEVNGVKLPEMLGDVDRFNMMSYYVATAELAMRHEDADILGVLFEDTPNRSISRHQQLLDSLEELTSGVDPANIRLFAQRGDNNMPTAIPSEMSQVAPNGGYTVEDGVELVGHTIAVYDYAAQPNDVPLGNIWILTRLDAIDGSFENGFEVSSLRIVN